MKKQYHPLVELVLLNDQPHTNVLKHLRNEWKYPDDFLLQVLDYCGNSFDMTNDFFHYLDGSDNLQDAWKRFREQYDIYDEEYPFDSVAWYNK